MASRKAAGDLFTSTWARTAVRGMQEAMKKKKNVVTTHRWKIVTGDMVEVISGHNIGERGKVMSVIRDQNRIVVENVNVRPRHIMQRNESDGGPQKKVVLKPCSIHYSNVALIDPSTDKPTKVERRWLEDGTPVRISKATGVVIPKPALVASERRTKERSNIVGPKDTASDDVFEVTFSGYEEHAKAIYTNLPNEA